MLGLEPQLGSFAQQILSVKYAQPGESWSDVARRVATNVLGSLGYGASSEVVREVTQLITQRKFIPGGRYLYAAGRDMHQVNNCLLLRCEDSREGWANLLWQSTMALMTGAGIGVNYSRVRPRGSRVQRTGGEASGPLSPMRIINELGRDVMQGGSRRSAIWAGLLWSHPDTPAFIRVKDWRPELRDLKASDSSLPMEMEFTNISVTLDDEFFEAYGDELHPRHELAHGIYRSTVKRMVKTGEPGFSIDTGENASENLRNACTEVTTADDSDVCNLGSINLARIESREELRAVVELATLFLLAGTVYSHVPYPKVAEVRETNRRLGLGLMGMHEWLLQRECAYGPDQELGEWLDDYAASTEVAADWADAHGLSRPVKTRAIAPNGTIGIIGETTTGIEPLFCAAYRRSYLAGGEWQVEHVIDPTAKRLVEQGADPEEIEDAYQLAEQVDRRLDFQRWVQRYVDHGISSTINLPHPIENPDEVADFGDLLMSYLPELRGMTVYPSGARAGQPLVPVSYHEATRARARIEGNELSCSGGICGV